jgi:cell division transport system permease protein
MVRYGVNNFTRNAWLTIAATAVMTITLLSIFITFVAQSVLQSSIETISNNTSMSIWLKPDTTRKQIQPVMSSLSKVEGVKSVAFIDSEQAKKDAAEQNKSDVDVLSAISEATNALPATLRVSVDDLSNTKQLDSFVKNDKALKQYINTSISPESLGKKQEIIQTIGGWTQTAQNIGWVASVVFLVVSVLIIFNTIRMAIFSRKEEIQMMKLIGADKRFIRGPFIVEAIVYGFIGALLATGIGYLLLVFAEPKLRGSGLQLQATIDSLTMYIGVVLLVMIVLGGIIGTISSLMATRRYLKI